VYFTYPKFSPDTLVQENDAETIVCWAKLKVTFKFSEESKRIATNSLFALLKNDVNSIDQLVNKVPSLSRQEQIGILSHLDEHRLLIEADPSGEISRTGKAVIVRLERSYMEQSWTQPQGKLDLLFFSGNATKELLVGHAFEYYHLTTCAYDALLPAINRLHGESQSLLMDFIQGEYRHDRIVIKALIHLGFNEKEIVESLPLPFTVALTDLLGYWARTDELAFQAALFIFEGRPSDAAEYHKALAKYDLPAGYLESHFDHDKVNDEGGHHDISRSFFKYIQYISEEDESRVAIKLSLLKQLLRRRSDSIYEYYSNKNSVIPRSSAKLKVQLLTNN
jgi:hypothetical protein